MKIIHIKYRSDPTEIPDSIKIYGALLKIAIENGNEKLKGSILNRSTRISSALPFYNDEIYFPVSKEGIIKGTKDERKRKKNAYVSFSEKIAKKEKIDIPRVNVSGKKIFYSSKEAYITNSGEIIRDLAIIYETNEEKELIKAFQELEKRGGLSARISQGFGEFKIIENIEYPKQKLDNLLVSRYIINKDDKINLETSLLDIGYISGKTTEGKGFGPFTYIKEGSKIEFIEKPLGSIINVNNKFIVGTPLILR